MRKNRLYPRAGIWWARIKVNNETKRVSTGCRDRAAAEIKYKELERQFANPALHASTRASFQEAADRLMENVVRSGKTAGTLEMYRTKAGHLLRIFGDCRLSAITNAMVEDYVTKRMEEGCNSLDKELCTLRRILKLAKHRKEYSGDIGDLMPFDFRSSYKPRKRHLANYQELQKLILELPPERAAMVCYMVATGARWSECVRAERSDINPEPGIILIRGTKTEGSWRQIPILDIFKPALDLALSIAPDSGRMFLRWTAPIRGLKNACRRAGINPLSPNDLRRTAASWLRQVGIDPSLIGRFLGHTDSVMVEQVYGQLTAQQLGAVLADRTGGNAAKRSENAPVLCAQFVPPEPLRFGTLTLRDVKNSRVSRRLVQALRQPVLDVHDRRAPDSQGNGAVRASTVPGLCRKVKPTKPRTKPRK